MLSGKDDDDNNNKTIMEPMFPRLHVKDAAANIGGPRAPPRNKMALYEQLSIPMQRFNSSVVVAAGKKKAAAVAMSSRSGRGSDAGCGHERQVLSPFYMPQPQALTHPLDNSNSQSFDGMNFNVTRSDFERGSINHKSDRSLVDTSPIAELSSLCQNECNTRDSGRKLYADNLRVGIVVPSKQEVILSGSPKPISVSSNSLPKRQFGSLHFSIQKLSSRAKPSEINTSNFKSRSVSKSFGERTQDARITREVTERSSSDKVADKSTTIIVPLDKDEITNTRNSLHGDSAACRDCDGDDDTTLNNRYCEALTIAREHCTKQSLCSKESPTNGSGSLNLDNKYKQNRGTNQSSDLGQKNEVLVTAMTESISGVEVTPDDIVGIIGSRHFLKARLAITNQQRVFAIQVFELHRLIKVQKLIAASPHLLLEGSLLGKSSQEVPTKNAECDSDNCSHEVAEVQKDRDQKEDQDMEIVTENFNIVPPLPACENSGNRDLEVQVPHGPSANFLQLSTALDNKPNAWYFHPPANQWFAPFMQPSEGFVHKPYAGPCPPIGGFMAPVAPVYGNCTPHSATMVAGDFVNQAYGVRASDRLPNMGVLPGGAAMVPNFYPAPYGLPSMNPIVSSSVVVEQVSYLAHPRPKGKMDQHSRSACNMSSARSEAYSPYLHKFQASKNSELQGSTASCPSGKAQTANNHACPSQSSGTHVIKAVPHNARSALESATRIFQSIQEERQQLDS